jgi:hypothetical protein
MILKYPSISEEAPRKVSVIITFAPGKDSSVAASEIIPFISALNAEDRIKGIRKTQIINVFIKNLLI